MSKSVFNTQERLCPDVVKKINSKYLIFEPDLNNFAEFLSRISISASYIHHAPEDFVVSLRAYPFEIPKFFKSVGEPSTFTIGEFTKNEVNTRGYKLESQNNLVLLTSFKVEPKFNSFLDFAPYTQIEIYLPFTGITTLDVNEVMGKTIHIYVAVDFDLGDLSYFITLEDGTMIDTYQTHVGVDIALSQTNGYEVARNLYSTIAQGVGGAYKGIVGNAESPSRTANSLAYGSNLATSILGAMVQSHRAGSVGSGRNELLAPTSPYLIITRVKPFYINDFAHLKGKPCMQTLTLSTLRGFTKVGDIHLEDIGEATENEKKIILDSLRSGVIL